MQLGHPLYTIEPKVKNTMGSIDPPDCPPTVRLAIFECGTPLPLAKGRYGTYGGMFEALFSAQQNPKAPATEKKITFSKYQVDYEGAEYPDLDEVDVILITGSSKFSTQPCHKLGLC